MAQKLIEIEKSGAWPILKYTLRGDGIGYATVFIDDNYGDIVINSGDQIALKHFWGKQGRGTETLRQFLIKASDGYLKDKFSYGLTRWYADAAMKDLKELIEEKIGGEHTWPEDLVEEVEDIQGNFTTSEGFYHLVSRSDEVTKIIDEVGEHPSGEESANRDAARFIDRAWPHLVAHWEQELIAEGRMIKVQVTV